MHRAQHAWGRCQGASRVHADLLIPAVVLSLASLTMRRNMMILPRSVLAISIGFWMSSGARAESVLVKWYRAEHDTRSEDPTAQGWTRVSDRAKSAVTGSIDGAARRGSRAWRLVDDDVAGAEDLYYFSTLTAEQMEVARGIGFSYRWRLRIPDDTGGVTRAISTEVCVASKGGDRLRFGVQMGRVGSELVASVFAGIRGAVSGSERPRLEVLRGGPGHWRPDPFRPARRSADGPGVSSRNRGQVGARIRTRLLQRRSWHIVADRRHSGPPYV